MPWLVAIERPDHTMRSAQGAITLKDEAVATSGDYRHSILIDAERLSQTIDPRTRRPLSNRVASVRVIAATTMEADALATALMVMGADSGASFARDQGIDALFMLSDGDAIREIGCGRFADVPSKARGNDHSSRCDPDGGRAYPMPLRSFRTFSALPQAP